MQTTELTIPETLRSYVKAITVVENTHRHQTDCLPFYANGYPGLLFRVSDAAPVLQPKGKTLSELFVYGQTIAPIEIHLQAPYKVLVFELHPFVVKMLFGVNPKELNDDCHDFLSQSEFAGEPLLLQLKSERSTEQQANLISAFLQRQVQRRAAADLRKTKLALDLIFSHKGSIRIKQLTEELNINERMLQRLFTEHVGVSPKQFAKMIQFHSSLSDLSDNPAQRLTDVVYQNGYADQSHFIRNFKKYTGDKPSQHKKKK